MRSSVFCLEPGICCSVAVPDLIPTNFSRRMKRVLLDGDRYMLGGVSAAHVSPPSSQEPQRRSMSVT